MKLAIWNTRGLGRKEKKRAVRRLVFRNELDMLLIHESKMNKVEDRLIQMLWGKGDTNSAYSPAVGALGGIISIWRTDFFKLDSTIITRIYVLCRGQLIEGGMECIIGNIYASNDEGEKAGLWAELKLLRESQTVPWLLCGDFSSIKQQDEKIDTTLSLSSIQHFSDFIADLELIDLPLTGAKFTWG